MHSTKSMPQYETHYLTFTEEDIDQLHVSQFPFMWGPKSLTPKFPYFETDIWHVYIHQFMTH